jgi:toluene monooxygenase electron transfer component
MNPAVHQIRLAGGAPVMAGGASAPGAGAAGETAARSAPGVIGFACGADDTLLRAAQRAGLGFPYECNVGSCGNCKFELIEGELANAWPAAPALTDKDRQRKRHLGCQSRPLSDCVIKLRPAPRYEPPHRPQRVSAVLTQRRAITHDISEFHFQLETPVAFEPGQYALVQLPGITGPRAYSMSNLEAGTWHFQVRQVPGGAGSAALFNLPLGATVALDGPYGMAWLRRDAPRDLLCLAGGSGLAPMISIARAAMAEPRLASRQLHFIYGGRTAADLCGQDMLAELPGYGQRLFWQGFVSPAPPEAAANPSSALASSAPASPTPQGQPSAGASPAAAYVHEAALQLHGERLRDMEIYFAGPPAMATAVQRMLYETGVPPDQQHFDQFY